MQLSRIDAGDLAHRGGPEGTSAYLRTLIPASASVEGAVREIIARVRAEGDAAILDYTRRFDTAGGEPAALVVREEELDDAIRQLPLELVAGLQVAIRNVALVAQAAVSEDIGVELSQGQRIVVREVPVGSAGVYVPGGRAPYASTVVMGVVSARAAGVLDVSVCAPPGPDGDLDPVILGTCRLCGVERVYRMGGAQAIAALAFGTESVRRVDVVVGPGNLYVQEAKRQLSATVGIDGFAGPSDLLVLLGRDAQESELRLAALDMLAQGEHGEGSLVVAATPAASVADGLAATLEELVVERPTVGEAAFAIVHVTDAREALDLANALAPEHLQLIGVEMEGLAPLVRSAGCVFVGPESATAFGDYVVGSNHVLPTGGSARFASMLSPRHFRRTMAEVRVRQGAAKLAAAGAPIARAEGFEVHAESMEARVRENPGE
ncbi:MAG TPA: histidinol dehydrogenase [Solirubrobacteraceae bacterium]|jgi:histidinol dehydrogenase|nr:histidinol dehydrogenase [Solirubrobacteraceae bacterium]